MLGCSIPAGNGGSVAPRGLGQVRVPVAAGASKRYEEGSSAERARVAKHSAGDRLRRAEHLAAGCGGDFVEPEGALVDWYWRRHRCARAGRSPEADTDLTVITCPDAA